MSDNKSMIQINHLDKDKIDLLKKTICKNASDNELQLFIHACNHTGLDPFMKQIYAIKRGDQMTIQTGIDGLRLIAERTGNYAPGREPTFTFGEKNELISATSYVKKRISDGSWHEVAATAFFDEFNAGQNLWKKMPKLMLAKCAESLALRRAFPADMSGLYSEEEMEQAEKVVIEPLITIEDAEQLEVALKEMPELKEKILTAYKASSFLEIEDRHLKTIWKGIKTKYKLEKNEITEETK